MSIVIRKNVRAIVLITTLLFLVVLLMIVGAALIMSGASRESSGSLQDNQAALLAAETGLDYARTRLQERPTWRGDGDGVLLKQTVVRSADDDLVVVEDNGSVVGYMTTATGIHSQFRLRFNYHDGDVGTAGDGDGLDDPDIFLPGPYVSTNNLGGSGPAPGPRAENVSGTWEVTTPPGPTVDVPSFTAYVVVEGYAGIGLRDQLQNPANPDPLTGGTGLRTSKRILEANFRRAFATGTDAVIYAHQSIESSLGPGGVFDVDTADPGSPPRIRTNDSVRIDPDTVGPVSYTTTSDGEVYVGDSGDFLVNGVAGTPGATQQATDESDFFALEWNDIRKADPSGPRIRAGTYIWRRDDGSGNPFLEYFPEEYNPANTYTQGAPGTIRIDTSNPNNFLLSGSMGTDANIDFNRYETEFLNDVYVEPGSGGLTGVAIVPESDVLTVDQSRPYVKFSNPSGDSPVLTSSGQVYVSGEIGGQGSVTAEGDITFQGSSALEVSPDQSVAIYSKQDVILEAIPDPVVSGLGSVVASVTGSLTSGSGSGPGPGLGPGSGVGSVLGGGSSPPPSLGYQDQAFAGIIFAGGNFRADLRTGTSNPGEFYLRGLLSSYGGDPATEAPGDNGGGQVGLIAENAKFIFDPAYVNNLIDLNAPTPLIRATYGILE